jgi:hypothetical protein
MLTIFIFIVRYPAYPHPQFLSSYTTTAFLLPESQVVILGGVDRLNRGDVIYGVYPDTTSFYQATAVEMPKKVPGKDVLVLVHFKDDGDEHGITHAKAVPMKHVMKVPYGAIQ